MFFETKKDFSSNPDFLSFLINNKMAIEYEEQKPFFDFNKKIISDDMFKKAVGFYSLNEQKIIDILDTLTMPGVIEYNKETIKIIINNFFIYEKIKPSEHFLVSSIFYAEKFNIELFKLFEEAGFELFKTKNPENNCFLASIKKAYYTNDRCAFDYLIKKYSIEQLIPFSEEEKESIIWNSMFNKSLSEIFLKIKEKENNETKIEIVLDFFKKTKENLKIYNNFLLKNRLFFQFFFETETISTENKNKIIDEIFNKNYLNNHSRVKKEILSYFLDHSLYPETKSVQILKKILENLCVEKNYLRKIFNAQNIDKIEEKIKKIKSLDNLLTIIFSKTETLILNKRIDMLRIIYDSVDVEKEKFKQLKKCIKHLNSKEFLAVSEILNINESEEKNPSLKQEKENFFFNFDDYKTDKRIDGIVCVLYEQLKFPITYKENNGIKIYPSYPLIRQLKEKEELIEVNNYCENKTENVKNKRELRF